MSKRVRVHLLDNDEDRVETVGPFNDVILYNWFKEKYESESGSVQLSISEAMDVASELYPLLVEIQIPESIDHINSVSALNSLRSISSVCQELLRFKSNNRRFSGFEIRWG